PAGFRPQRASGPSGLQAPAAPHPSRASAATSHPRASATPQPYDTEGANGVVPTGPVAPLAGYRRAVGAIGRPEPPPLPRPGQPRPAPQPSPPRRAMPRAAVRSGQHAPAPQPAPP